MALHSKRKSLAKHKGSTDDILYYVVFAQIRQQMLNRFFTLFCEIRVNQSVCV